MNLEPVTGHEQGGERPALIVSNDLLNSSPAELVIVAPITGKDRGIPAHVRVNPPEGGLRKPSAIMADQVRTISRHCLGRRLGTIATATLDQVNDRLRLVLDLGG